MEVPMSASPKQLQFVDSLYAERIVPHEVRELVAAKARLLAPKDFSRVIDIVKGLPKKSVPVLEPGTYEDGDVIFRVQVSRESGRPYAKVWTGTSWVYDGSAYRAHAATAVVVPLERAIEIGVATGHCVCCARDLTDPLSVQAGIGPVCVQRYGTTREEIIAGRQQELVTA
jgi:hypothetical protein